MNNELIEWMNLETKRLEELLNGAHADGERLFIKGQLAQHLEWITKMYDLMDDKEGIINTTKNIIQCITSPEQDHYNKFRIQKLNENLGIEPDYDTDEQPSDRYLQ